MPDRRKPLRTTKPLERGGPLHRKTPMRSGGPRTSTPCPSPSKAARDAERRQAEREAKAIAWARSGGLCELGMAGWCEGAATNFSHRLGAGVLGGWSAANGLYSCGSGTTGCHGWVHDQPAAARELGWRLERRCGDDPLVIPARHARFGWVLLDEEGGVVPSDLRFPW